MSVALVAPGRAMALAGNGAVALWQRLAGAGGGSATGSGPSASGIAGLSGWWDASSYGGMLDANGNAIPAWNSTVGSLTDNSGGGRPMTVYRAAGSGQNATAKPRLSGLLGGLGATVAGGTWTPSLDPDLGFRVSGISMASGQAWTRFLVWSRPNWRQSSGKDSEPVALLTSGSIVVLQADSAGGSNRLILFPGAQQTVLTSSLTRRHTHSVILRNTPGAGVDVWLDGTQVATGAANPIGSAAASLLFLHDGTSNGAAQCWFHEAASWERALTGADIATLLTAAARWTRGPRKGVVLLFTGQSNAVYATLSDGAGMLLAQGVAWYLGALAWGMFASNAVGSATEVGGHGIYAAPPYAGDFVHNPGDGSDPSTWAEGADGQWVQTFMSAQSAPDLADCDAIVWWWSETDSTRAYTEKATFEAAARRWLALERGMVPGATAGSLPLIWWNAMPFGSGTDNGTQMHREAVAALAADATQNVAIGLPMTAGALPRGAAPNGDGTWSGGDYNHLDSIDNIGFARLAAPVVARAILSSRGGDSIAAIPVGVPAAGGPRIASAQYTSPTTVLLTVVHDAGTDLRVPLLAAHGAGFAVMDGGSVASPGTVRTAVACIRVDATHLQITLASPLVNPATECLLFYPYGHGFIGRGNVVTDNFSALPSPPGWNIGGDLGSAWVLDCPLAATTVPIVLHT